MVTKAELLVMNKGLQEHNNDLMAALSRKENAYKELQKEIVITREVNAQTRSRVKYIDGQLEICQAVMRKAGLLPTLDEMYPKKATDGKLNHQSIVPQHNHGY